MTPKEYLSQASRLDARINIKIEHAAHLRALLTRGTAIITGMPRAQRDEREPSPADKLIDLEAEINADIDRLVDLKREIAQAIANVASAEYRTLLEARYLTGWKWERIEDEMHADRITLWRWHGRALNEIKIPEKLQHYETLKRVIV